MGAHELEEALEICAGSPAQREELLQLQRSVDGVWLGRVFKTLFPPFVVSAWAGGSSQRWKPPFSWF